MEDIGLKPFALRPTAIFTITLVGVIQSNSEGETNVGGSRSHPHHKLKPKRKELLKATQGGFVACLRAIMDVQWLLNGSGMHSNSRSSE